MKYLALALTLAVGCAFGAAPDARTEIRYCGPPQRTESGSIVRSVSTLSAFRKKHPCPVTGKTTGACEGWFVDHVIPLACGGCDTVWNMQWLPRALKSAKQIEAPGPKDRWEREVYAKNIPDTDACKFVIQEK